MFFVVCDGLKGLPDSVNTAFPRALVQTCIIHLIRNTFRYARRKYAGLDQLRLEADLNCPHRSRSTPALR